MKAASAIADPVRREILLLLNRRVLSAGEIAVRFEISRPAVSRHLRVLREAGLVAVEEEGRQRFYRLSREPLVKLERWLARLHDRWPDSLDALETEVYRTRRERRTARSHQIPTERSA